jgi:two-component system sensor histidine kinase ChvG
MTLARLHAIRLARPSRIGLRLLAFNVLVVFVPVVGILYLDVYESRLLEAQERGMVQQARLLAAALGGADAVDAAAAHALLARFEQRSEARLRVYDRSGSLVADSARVPAISGADRPDEYATQSGRQPAVEGARHRFLYRVGAWLSRVRRAFGDAAFRALAPDPFATNVQPSGIAPELRAALQGHYGAATRRTPGQRSLTLNCAVPVVSGTTVTGAVLASQSTFRILQALYDVRLRVFEIVVASLVAAAVLSIVASATIVRPLVRLRRTAMALADRRGHLPGAFRQVDRRDEIGDLARALEDLAGRLDAHIRLLESFAADVSHEFRNPLSSIRAAAETIAQADDPVDRARFLHMLTRDVDRLERLVSGVRELARMDAQLAYEPAAIVDVPTLLAEIVEGMQLSGKGTIALRAGSSPLRVRGSADRLAQVFENVLQNACSFTPDGVPIEVDMDRDGADCVIVVTDRGPGIPPAHLDRVFERFFTYRPNAHGQTHAGLGLAIARTVVESYNGTIAAANRPDGGARFEVRLPLV